MSDNDESLQTILDNILSEFKNVGKQLDNSILHTENDEKIAEITSKSAITLLKSLKSIAPAKLEANKVTENEFEAAVLRTWKAPLDLLDLLLYISLEVASEFSSEYGNETSLKRDYLLVALVKQQTNACLVFNEIIHLLKSGFPSGSHSLWRTLHEIACVSYFISKRGENMAKRYLDYEKVENYFQAEAILKHQQEIGCRLLSEEDFQTIRKRFAKMKKSYGSDFVKNTNYPYGWVPPDVLKSRSLREIEKLVELDVLRPYYDLACYNVLGGPGGLMFSRGINEKNRKSLGLLAGPSNYGLADPGKVAAISLGQVTACLLQAKPTVKNLIIVEAMRALVDEICSTFDEIEAEFSKASRK
jgi:hypothetical protein